MNAVQEVIEMAGQAPAGDPAEKNAGRFENTLSVALLLAMPLLPLLEMVTRKAFDRGIPGTMPLVQHLTLWAAFAGACLAARSDRLLALSTAAFLPERCKRPARLLAAFTGVALSAWLFVSSLQLIKTLFGTGETVAWGIPTWAALAIMPAGFAILAVRLMAGAAGDWKGRAVAAGGCLIPVAVTLFPQWRDAGLALPIGLLIVVATLAGMPLFAAIGGGALLFFWNADIPITAAADEIYKLSASEFLPAIPMFTLGGYILAAGGSSRRLTGAFTAIFGWMPGGLAIATTAVLAFFTPLTGASGVTILSMGPLFLPLMLRARYPENTSLGLVTVAGSIGLLLPPSLPVILYAISAQIPIPKLFAAGAVPGVLLILAVAMWGARQGSRAGAVSTPFRMRTAVTAVWAAKWELFLPVVVLASYFGGYATLVETSALTVLYAVVVECWVYREIGPSRDLPRITLECAAVVGGFLIVIGAALAFTNYLITAEVPMRILDLVRTHIHSPWVFLLVLNIFLLIVGALMDIYSAILVVVPLIAPIGAAYGIDPVHLGIVFLANMELGYLTPPMGENLFLSSLAFNKPLTSVYRATLPYSLALLAAVLLITYVPAMTLGVARWVYP